MGLSSVSQEAYCTSGVRYPCPPGRYGAEYGLQNSTCSGSCRPGFYCPEMSNSSTMIPCGNVSTYCPSGSELPQIAPSGRFTVPLSNPAEERTGTQPCSRGHWCEEGIKHECPPGRYGSMESITTPSCSGECAEGFFCPSASVNATMSPCGNFTVYCPAGSGSPFSVPSGTYSVPLHIAEGFRFGFTTCEPGFWCEDGIRHECPPGRYGDRFGLGNMNCSGPCLRGYYCPAGSNTSSVEECGGVDVYCPEGTGSPLVVAEGFNSVPEQSPAYVRHGVIKCEPGSYCTSGVRYPCPPGRYGAEYGLQNSTCSGSCRPGFYCPEMSNSSTMIPCGSVELFCPSGSSGPQNVPKGFFSQPEAAPENQRSAAQVCGRGAYCLAGRRYGCPPGRYGLVSGIEGGDCSGVCTQGYYCPKASTSATERNCGSRAVYCPTGSGEPLRVPSGYLSGPRDSPEDSRWHLLPCDIGQWCQNGENKLCPAGRFGSEQGLGVKGCSGPCSPGYFCPEGSNNSMPEVCGSIAHFCPEGSANATTVPDGYFSTPENGPADLRKSAEECPLGHWCNRGEKHACPAGRYANITKESTSLCTGPCMEGHYCPEASVSSMQYPCGNTSMYCPLGASVPRKVPAGYYSTPLASSPAMRKSIAICDAGFWCNEGNRYACPKGRFGYEEGLTTPDCSGSCEKGYYCPPASTNATQNLCGSEDRYCPPGSGEWLQVPQGFFSAPLASPPNQRYEVEQCPRGSWCQGGIRKLCPPGRFGNGTALSIPDCTGPCAAGYYCERGAIVANEHDCGGIEVFCPEGSSAPARAMPGEYTVPQMSGESVRKGSSLCEEGSWCINGTKNQCHPVCHCPKGSFTPTVVAPFPLVAPQHIVLIPSEEAPAFIIEGTPANVSLVVVTSAPMTGNLSMECLPASSSQSRRIMYHTEVFDSQWSLNNSYSLLLPLSSESFMFNEPSASFTAGDDAIVFEPLNCNITLVSSTVTVSNSSTIDIALIPAPGPRFWRSWFRRHPLPGLPIQQRQATKGIGFIAITGGKEVIFLEAEESPKVIASPTSSTVNPWKWIWEAKATGVIAWLERADGSFFPVGGAATDTLVELSLPPYRDVCWLNITAPHSNTSTSMEEFGAVVDFCDASPHFTLHPTARDAGYLASYLRST